MAEDTTRLIISIETLLKGLEKTLKGLDTLDRKLKSVGKTPPSTAAIDKSIARNTQLRQRAEKAEEQANVRSFQRRLNSVASAEKQRTTLVEREARRRAVIERNTEQQGLRDFQQRINRINIAERQRTQVAAREAATRVRTERAAEQLNLRNFQQRVRLLDRAEQQRIRSERAAFGALPQADAHVQAFRRIQQATATAAAAATAANARFQSLGNSLRSIGQGATTLGFALTAAISVPLVAFGKSALDAAVTIDSLKRGLTAIVGSADEAGKQLTRLTEIAKLPGIGFEEAIQGSIRLQAVGFSAADAEKALIQFSNAVALTGGGREELARITVQLGQLAAKGKVLSQDLRPIIEAAPKVGTALIAAFGTVNADDIADMTTNSREFLDTLVKELERLPRAAAGARNTFENFRDTVFRASAAIGEALIPVLTKLIEFIEPVLVGLSSAFRQLHPAIQVAVVLFVASTAAIGPLVIGLGFLGSAIGRITVGLAQMTAQGFIPATISLQGFNTAVTATIVRLTGLQAATIRAGGPWIALATAIGVVAAAILLIDTEELTAATEDQLKSTKGLVDGYKDEIKLLDSLKTGVAATADEQKRLDAIYKSLGIQAELRIKSLSSEEQRLAALRGELSKLLEAEKERLRIQGASIAGKFAQDLQKFNELQAERLEIEKAILSIESGGRAPIDGTARSEAQKARQLTDQHGKLNEKLAEQEELVRKGAAGLKVYEEVSGQSADEAFRLSRTLGGMEGVSADVTDEFKRLTLGVEDTTDALKEFKRVLDAVTVDFTDTDKIDKRFDTIIKRIKETTHSTQDGVGALNNYIQLIPELADVIERKRGAKTTGGFITSLFDEKEAADKGTGLRNAQEALEDALAKLAEESKEHQIAIEKSKNDELLRLNDSRFRQELISYQEFIGERSRLQQVEIQGEIDRQRKIAELATADALRQQQRAGVTKGAEATRARAAEQQSLAKKVEAESKILELQSRQKDIAADAENDLREFNKDRLRDFRELSRELDEILGKEKAAGEAAVDERFRETLIALNNEMALVQKILRQASIDQNVERVKTARAARDQIQSQITSINNHKTELKAVVAIRDAQEQISRAEERQSNLEREIAFQVDFRGLSEREAVRQRLEGEKLVRAEIEKQRVVIEAVIATLKQAGLEVPLALIEGLERFKVATKGLGESSFSEQFKLAEIDLGKIADELGDKIADVERAIRSRTISELEGRLIIRRLNGEYVGELEKQLEVLKAIAAASGDESLKRQAQSAEQSVKDTRAAADELKNFSKQLESVAVDSFGDSLSQLFKDLRDNTESATQDILNFLNNIANRVGDFIAENFARQIAESLFPDPKKGGSAGILDTIKGLFGIGGGSQAASLTTVGVTLSSSIAGAAATFASIVTAAGAAFAAAVGVGSVTSSVSDIAGGLAGLASGAIVPAAPSGRIIKVAEGGHAEAVLTSDPRFALRQAAILRQFLRMTRGLSGHFRSVPEFAEGGIITARDAETNLLASLASSRTPSLASVVPSELAVRGDSSTNINLRNINLLDKRQLVGGHLRSAEGAIDIMNIISENRDEIGRRIGVK